RGRRIGRRGAVAPASAARPPAALQAPATGDDRRGGGPVAPGDGPHVGRAAQAPAAVFVKGTPMGAKRNRSNKLITARPQSGITLTPAKGSDARVMAGPPAVGRQAASRFRWKWLLAGIALLYVLSTAVYLIARGSMDRSKEIVSSFMKDVNAGNRAALDMLGPAAVFDDEPVSEDEAEAKYADFYLRHPELIVREVRAGEPDTKGKQKPSPRRFT